MDKKTFVLNSIKVVIFAVNGKGRAEEELTVPVSEMMVHPNMFIMPSVGSEMSFTKKNVSFAGTTETTTMEGIVRNITYRYQQVMQEMAGNSLYQTVEITIDLNHTVA